MSVSKILKIRNLGVLLFVAGIILVMIMVLIFGSNNPNTPIPLFLSFLGLVVVASVSLVSCPYCNKRFFWSWRFANPFTNRCMNCGKGKESDAL